MDKKPNLTGLNVLIIDNNLTSLDQIKKDLNTVGADIYTSRNVDQA